MPRWDVVEVRVNGLRFRGPHGVFESEKTQGNDFLASIRLTHPGRAGETDALADTVDYAALAGLMLETSASRSFDTVERLAGAFLEAAFERFPTAQRIEVTLDKLSPPMDAQTESCGVRLVRDR